jgi:rSAM/selenodomain-associated transferase 1
MRGAKVLLAQRASTKAQGDLWEFPGGKVGEGESDYAAIHREIAEELHCRIKVVARKPTYVHHYADKTIQLIPFLCAPIDEPQAVEHQALVWSNWEACQDYALAAADRAMLASWEEQQTSAPSLLLFAKAPIEAEVKTRLIPQYGAPKALAVYHALLQASQHLLQGWPYPKDLWTNQFWPHGHEAFTDAFDELHLQQGVDLGAKMWHAAQAYSGPCILIGADCPYLNAQHLEETRQALQSHDVVLGPAADGGYTLIAWNEAKKAWFEDVAWSTDQVLAQTLEKMQGLKVHLLERLADIDEPSDWENYVQNRLIAHQTRKQD